MSRKGRDFELKYAWLNDLNKDYKIITPAKLIDKITGEKREIDVLIEYTDQNGKNRTIAVECRNHKEKQNVMWIEQLIQKKKDLGIDCLICPSTSDFSKASIIKARHYGVELEKAELLDKEQINCLKDRFYCDCYYTYTKIKEMSVVIDNKVLPLHECLIDMNIIERYRLLKIIQIFILPEYNIHNDFSALDIKEDDFFKSDIDTYIDLNRYHIINKDTELYMHYGISVISYKAIIKPLRVSYPLNESLSIFTEEGKNKKYKAVFDDKNEITVGYIGDDYIHVNVKLEPIRHHRLIGGSSSINTVFPKNKKVEYILDNVFENGISECDLEEVQ